MWIFDLLLKIMDLSIFAVSDYFEEVTGYNYFAGMKI